MREEGALFPNGREPSARLHLAMVLAIVAATSGNIGCGWTRKGRHDQHPAEQHGNKDGYGASHQDSSLARSTPRVREAWVMQHLIVGERLEEFQQIQALSGGQMIRASGVVFQSILQLRHLAVMQVGRGEGDVPERWSLEVAGIFVETSPKGDPTVALEAGCGLAEENHLTAFGRIGNGAIVAAVVVTIIGRTRGNDAALKTGDCLGDVGDRKGIGVTGKRFDEKVSIGGIGTKHRQEAVVFSQAQFDWMLAEHRHQGLPLQDGHGWVGPSQDRAVGNVDQTHGATRMLLARRANGGQAGRQ